MDTVPAAEPVTKIESKPEKKPEVTTSGFTYFGAFICGSSVLSFLVAASAKPAPPDIVLLMTITAFGTGLLLIGLGGIITLLREIASKLEKM